MYCECEKPEYEHAYGSKPITCLKCGKRRKPKGTVESRLRKLEAENAKLKEDAEEYKQTITDLERKCREYGANEPIAELFEEDKLKERIKELEEEIERLNDFYVDGILNVIKLLLPQRFGENTSIQERLGTDEYATFIVRLNVDLKDYFKGK